jgi:hypothetical protein
MRLYCCLASSADRTRDQFMSGMAVYDKACMLCLWWIRFLSELRDAWLFWFLEEVLVAVGIDAFQEVGSHSKLVVPSLSVFMSIESDWIDGGTSLRGHCRI